MSEALTAANAEIARLNKWADSFSDAQLKERALAEAVIRELRAEIAALRGALEPFAAFADPSRRMPGNFRISAGSPFAKRQLSMDDCYRAADALSRPSPPGSESTPAARGRA